MTTRRKWTEQDDVLLRRMLNQRKENPSIAAALDRTVMAIYTRRRQLDLVGETYPPNVWRPALSTDQSPAPEDTSAVTMEDLAPETYPIPEDGFFPVWTKSYLWGLIKITKYRRPQ